MYFWALSFKSIIKTNVKVLKVGCLGQRALRSTTSTSSQGPYISARGVLAESVNNLSSEQKVSILREDCKLILFFFFKKRTHSPLPSLPKYNGRNVAPEDQDTILDPSLIMDKSSSTHLNFRIFFFFSPYKIEYINFGHASVQRLSKGSYKMWCYFGKLQSPSRMKAT